MHQLEISISQSRTNIPLNRVKLNCNWTSINLGEYKITEIFFGNPSCSQPLRSLQIKKSTSPKTKILIVGRKGQLGTTNHQDPDSWTCEAIGTYNHLLPMVEVR